MAIPLAEAFVRVRADTRDFKRDTERDASQSGDKAAGTFAGTFGRTLAAKARGMFSGLRRDAESATDGAGTVAGRRFGTEFTRDALGKLRDARGRFVAEGSAGGAGFGGAFVRDAAGKLRDARGRFAAEGSAAGDGFSSAFNRGAGRGLTGMGMLIAAGVALGPAIIPVAAAAAAAIAGIGTAGIAATAGLGVGILAFVGIADAVKAMGAAEKAASSDAATLSRAHSAVASAADGVRSAEQSLARTREQVAESNASSARRVAEAQRDLNRVEADARDIALELNDARREAQERLANLTQSVKENALAQRQSNLDIAEAKAALDKVIADPKATEAQREQARITYEREVLQLDDLKRRGLDMAAEQAQSVKAGVEGSREVVAARQRIADADERVRDAQTALADARRDQQRQERDGLYQIQQAAQQLVSAQRSLRDATVASGTAGAAAMTKLRDSMSGLSPAGQRFAKFLHGLRDEARGLRDAAAEGLLPGAQRAIENLLPYLPRVEGFIGRIAGRLGDMAVRASEALESPFWLRFFTMIDQTAGPALDGMFEATGNIVTGLAAILQAFLPLNKDMGSGLVGLTASFSEWAQGLSDSKGFQGFIAYVRENGPVVLNFFRNVFVLAGKLVAGLAGFGAGTLVGLNMLVGLLAGMSPETLGRIGVGVSAIASAIFVFSTVAKAAAAATVLWNGAQKVAAATTQIWAGVQWLLNAALVANPIGIVVVALVALVAALVVAYNSSDRFRAIVQQAWAGIQVAISYAWSNVIKPVFEALKWYVTEVMAPMFLWWYREVIKPTFERVTLAVQVAWTLIKVVFGLWQIYFKTVLAPLITWFYDRVIRPVFAGISATIRTMWESGIKPVFQALGGFLGKSVVPAIEAGVKGVGKAWEKIRDLTKIPVRFVVQTVLNEAIIRNYNKLARVFGVDEVKEIGLPKGFARGGVLPGYTPGRDTHRFVSPTGGALDLSGGEAIIRPEGTRALGRGWVDGINQAARSGGVSAVQRFLGQGYADGGILDRLGRAASAARKKAGDVLSGVGNMLTDPAGAMRTVVDKVLNLVPGKDSGFGRLVTAVPRKVAGTVIDKVKSFFTGGEDGGAGIFGPSPLGGSGGMMRILRAKFPGLKLLSGFRPGSITLTGSRSYHSTNRAVDVPPIRAVAEHIFTNFRAITKELITPWQEFNLHNGKPHHYSGAVWNQHNWQGGNAHDHWAAKGGGIMPARLYDRGGDWPSGTVGVNLSGRTEHVSTGASMDRVANLLATILVALRTLTDAVRAVAPGVGQEINGAASGALQRGRAMG
ncbi:hypothetical protein OOJ91_12330 [Micromonospora lupini]|uniref:hypothetical protein n=1 Tax=Micromonospora lupini TaxID=285679 RepID=UPI00224F8DAB|nr:hypothetical protein [Micromonospora lupini]MCX5066666.1 hypothetical protein [Micromonospora lupini]